MKKLTPGDLQEMYRRNPDLAARNADAVPDVNRAVAVEDHAADLARRRKESEAGAQERIIRWADEESGIPELAWLHHSPNGGHRHVAVAAKMKRMGTRAGWPDLVLPVRRGCYVGFALELKVGKNKPTDTQLAWIDHLAREGWYCSIQWGADNAIDEIEWYLSLGVPG